MRLAVTLPNGRRCSVGQYAQAWAAVKHCDPRLLVPGFSRCPQPAGEVLAELRRGLDERINERAEAA